MYQGKIVDIIDPKDTTFERLGLLMGGAHPEEKTPEAVVSEAAHA
jgi:hypothetical protein